LKKKNIKNSKPNKTAAKFEIIKYSKNSREEADIASKRTLNAARNVPQLKEVKTFVCRVSKGLEMDRIGDP